MARNSLVRVGISIALTLFLSACAVAHKPAPATGSRANLVMDGLDLSIMNTVLLVGFTDIQERAYQEPSLDELFIRGLNGFKSIDPKFELRVFREHAVLFYKDRPVRDLGKLPGRDMQAWCFVVLRSILMARKLSPEMHAANDEVLYKAVFTSALTDLDAYSRYAPREDAIRNRLVRDGVIGLGVRLDVVPDGAAIQSIVTEGPADLAGLRIGDVIVEANGVSLKGRTIADIRRRLDGIIGTNVALRVLRTGEDSPFGTLAALDLVVPDTVASTFTDGILELHVTRFNQRTTDAVERAVTTARNDPTQALKGIVIDLRNDPGGLLDQAIDTADLFLDSGSIVTLNGRHPGAYQYYEAHTGDIARGIPIALIVDGKSASASEILAAALQDNGRAAVVGTVSWGKGSVQTVRRLPNGGELSLTWARATSPGGVALHGLGLLPDICLSGEAPAADDVIRQLLDGKHLGQDARRLWRGAKDDAALHDKLRTDCPPEAHQERALDMEIARKIVSDPVLLAHAVADDTPQLAVRP